MGESGLLSVDKSVAGVLVVVDGLERRGDSLENSLPNPPVTSQGDPFPGKGSLQLGKGTPAKSVEWGLLQPCGSYNFRRELILKIGAWRSPVARPDFTSGRSRVRPAYSGICPANPASGGANGGKSPCPDLKALRFFTEPFIYSVHTSGLDINP